MDPEERERMIFEKSEYEPSVYEDNDEYEML
jgi:hypothetical protein